MKYLVTMVPYFSVHESYNTDTSAHKGRSQWYNIYQDIKVTMMQLLSVQKGYNDATLSVY